MNEFEIEMKLLAWKIGTLESKLERVNPKEFLDYLSRAEYEEKKLKENLTTNT
jgi:hypothetical protein